MAKHKNRIDPDKIQKKNNPKPRKQLNPFEVHINKEKISVLGRRLKHDRGRPGISRSRANKRRKETLGREYNEKHKTNRYNDKRIGRDDLTGEETANARFVAEKLSQFKVKKKDALYNLNDDEVLTHRGQTLEEIEKFDDQSDDDDELDKLDEEYTAAAHFGGDPSDGNRKSAIDDLIAEQKRRKMEMYKEKEEVRQLTGKLDDSWQAILPLLGKLAKDDGIVKPKPDTYDRALKEMIFEPRGEVSDRLVSADDLAKSEKERLERLERERLDRMNGVTEEMKKPTHRSADDLDDGYYVEAVRADDKIIAYNINGDEKPGESDNDDKDFDDKSVENSDEESDHLSDLKDSDSDSDRNESKNDSNQLETIPKQQSLADRNKMITEAANELPYTFDMPPSYEELEKLLKNRSAEYQSVILDRLIKSNHPKLERENKGKMIQLFAFLLQHINDTFDGFSPTKISDKFKILDRILPHLYDLSQMNPTETGNLFIGVIKEKYSDYQSDNRKYPDLETLIFFKLASHLYSTSDYRHPVVTPTVIFISEILSRCRIQTRKDISMGLFLVTIVLEYTELSKRFIPAVLNYLSGLVYLTIVKRPVELLKIIPPFKYIGKENSLLVIEDPDNSIEILDQCLTSRDLIELNIDDNFRVRALNTTLKLINSQFDLLTTITGCQYFIEPFKQLLPRIDIKNYPKFVADNLINCQKCIERIGEKKFDYIVEEAKRPKSLRFFEPKIVRIFDDKRNRHPSGKAKAERTALMRSLKRETKGAVREIRRDNAFLTKMNLKKQMISDAERKEKVRQIFAEASLQQGELNALDRFKKKKKF